MRSACLHVGCEMHHEHVYGYEAAMLPGRCSVCSVGAVAELQGLYPAESRAKCFAMGSQCREVMCAYDESIAASNASGYPPAVFCLLGEDPQSPVFVLCTAAHPPEGRCFL